MEPNRGIYRCYTHRTIALRGMFRFNTLHIAQQFNNDICMIYNRGDDVAQCILTDVAFIKLDV